MKDEAGASGGGHDPGADVSGGCSMPSTLTRRADFLACARARKAVTPGMIVQARARDGGTARVGYTCSKKIGNAVARNRAKRRLRAVARAELAGRARPGWDYVLIGRSGSTNARPFDDLRRDLSTALDRLHRERRG